jgi:hypothetical protein
MYFFLGQTVFVIHIIFLLGIVLIPLISNNIHLLIIHMMTCILVLLHWSLNNDVCALTYLEQLCMGISKDESFIHRIVSPIYNYNTNHEQIVLTFLLILFSLISLTRLCNQKEKIIILINDIKKMILQCIL